MKNKVLIITQKLPVYNLVLCLALVSVFMLSCNNDSEVLNQEPVKELITIDNLGQVHNYLLDKYEKSSLKSTLTSKTFGDVYNEFERILLESEKYSTNSTILSDLTDSEKLEILNKFADLKLDNNFQKEFKRRFITYFQSLQDIDADIKADILNTVNNYTLIDSPDDFENKRSYNLAIAYNNVYKSSMDYWGTNNKLKSVNITENQAIIWADAAGALIGLGCGGVMSILMGAATSNMIVECYNME
ncbi:hypothetical protein [Saccharicrinis sp. FJH54]|uniref:hypothetical protein n=1 Tax=Saccharicrinis sp. FJH54 TaxID=3344665 RepID=UPI0035D4D4B0